MKRVGEQIDRWANFGKRFVGCPVGRYEIGVIDASMQAAQDSLATVSPDEWAAMAQELDRVTVWN